MSVHEETVAEALGEIETPMQRLQRQRDGARSELQEMVAVAWRIKKPAHVGGGWWWYTDALAAQDEIAAWREDGYDLDCETLYVRGRS